MDPDGPRGRAKEVKTALLRREQTMVEACRPSIEAKRQGKTENKRHETYARPQVRIPCRSDANRQ